MRNPIPNIPNLIGKGLGRVIHAPVDLVQGVVQGFTAAGKPSQDEHEQIEHVEQPAPVKDQ